VSVERSDRIRAAAATRSLAATARAGRSLRELHHRGADVNFAAVAAIAGVSRQFLYTHPQLRDEIKQLRGERDSTLARTSTAKPASEASLRSRLRAALDDNQRLREANTRLRDELAVAHGRARELETSQRTGRTTPPGDDLPRSPPMRCL
jgi:Family of unknown function (DUF6262)